MSLYFKIIICSLALLSSGYSFALFRCGNVFQDRPCDTGGVQIAPTAPARAAAKPQADSNASASPATVSPFAMACARIGKSSLDIIWKREAGVLRGAQYATAPSDLEHKKLVSSVYERRGTAPEIRAAIETDCIGEKQRAADTAAAIAVLQNAQGNTSAVKEPSSKVATPTAAAGESAPAIKKSINATQCADLNNELIFLQASSRRGGSVATMEGINAQRRAIDSKISSTKC